MEGKRELQKSQYETMYITNKIRISYLQDASDVFVITQRCSAKRYGNGSLSTNNFQQKYGRTISKLSLSMF
jgi:hypothetical protein